MLTIANALLQELQAGRNTMLVTIIAEGGSAPRGAGAQMLVGEQGRITGTVGGGPVELKGEQLAKELLSSGGTTQHEFLLYVNSKEDVGSICGGRVTLDLRFADASDPVWAAFAEKWAAQLSANLPGMVILPMPAGVPAILDEAGSLLAGGTVEAPAAASLALTETAFCLPLEVADRVLLFGAGHVAAALAPVLDYLGFRLTVLDSRPDLLTADRFPMADKLLCIDFADIASAVDITPRDYVVVMTSGHVNDFDVERHALRKNPAYLGVIGSRRKIAAANEKLLADGFTPEELAGVHTPIGLPIGAVTPNEIAVSIAAELIQIRAQRRKTDGTAEHSGCPMKS